MLGPHGRELVATDGIDERAGDDGAGLEFLRGRRYADQSGLGIGMGGLSQALIRTLISCGSTRSDQTRLIGSRTPSSSSRYSRVAAIAAANSGSSPGAVTSTRTSPSGPAEAPEDVGVDMQLEPGRAQLRIEILERLGEKPARSAMLADQAAQHVDLRELHAPVEERPADRERPPVSQAVCREQAGGPEVEHLGGQATQHLDDAFACCRCVTRAHRTSHASGKRCERGGLNAAAWRLAGAFANQRLRRNDDGYGIRRPSTTTAAAR